MGIQSSKTASELAELQGACARGDTERIRELLSRADPSLPNQIDRNTGQGAIHVSVEKGKLESVKALNAFQQLNVNLKNYNLLRVENETALHMASRLGRLDIVKWLIGNGAKVNERDGSDWSPLHHAIFKGHESVALYLVEMGADLNAQPEGQHQSALMLAAYKGCLELVKKLVDAGAQVNQQTYEGKTALSFAQENDYDHGYWPNQKQRPHQKSTFNQFAQKVDSFCLGN